MVSIGGAGGGGWLWCGDGEGAGEVGGRGLCLGGVVERRSVTVGWSFTLALKFCILKIMLGRCSSWHCSAQIVVVWGFVVVVAATATLPTISLLPPRSVFVVGVILEQWPVVKMGSLFLILYCSANFYWLILYECRSTAVAREGFKNIFLKGNGILEFL